MKISGFTIIRNAERFAYPFREAVLSVLPVCDEFIINVGKSDDNTLELAASVNDSRIRIVESEWDMELKGGKVLSTETNKAMSACSGDWLFYIQADEVLHEKYIDVVRNSAKRHFNSRSVEGLRFRYKHFYGSYDYYQDNYRKWYVKEIRVIRNLPGILSWGDAMDFRHKDGSKLKSKDIDAEIYHYGWVRPPDVLLHKRSEFEKLYNDEDIAAKNIAGFRNYDDLGHLRKFTGTHPSVMKERIEASNWDFDAKLCSQRSEWLRKMLIFLYPLTKRARKILRNGAANN